jgi:ATP-binding cassette subfamily F protein uup
MAENLLSVHDIGVNLGDRWLLRGVDVSLEVGDRLCLVGRNGAGKSTLMKIMAGLAETDEGSLWVAPGKTVSYLPQAPALPKGMSLSSIVQHGTGSDGDSVIPPHKADAYLTRMGMDPNRLSDGLSGGESRRVALARALVKEPDVLLMDEPTNHLDLPTITWMEDLLTTHTGALVVISHDRAFLKRIGSGTLWIDNGKCRRRQGGFDGFDEWAEVILAEEQVRREKLDKRISSETRWSREGISARRKRNQGRVRELQEMRQTRATMAAGAGRSGRMMTASTEGGGQIVLEAIDLTASVPAPATLASTSVTAGSPQTVEKASSSQASRGQASRRTLFKHFNQIIRKGDRIGIIGPNGAGKSTLVKILLDQLAPDAGRVKVGYGLEASYFDQQREALSPDQTPWQVLCPDGGDTVERQGRTVHVKRYLQDFLFDEYKVTQRVRTLSGGEQNRLLLARLFVEQHNMLVLDEPTNDLDMETLELLQEVIADYKGTIIIISHDRDFIDRTVTAVMAFEDDGRIITHAGGYSDYLARRQKQQSRKTDLSSSKSKAAQKPKRPDRPHDRKLSFKDKHALETLPAEMASLEKSIRATEEKLADPDLFSRDADLFQLLVNQLSSERELLARQEERWLEAALLQQEIEESDSDDAI